MCVVVVDVDGHFVEKVVSVDPVAFAVVFVATVVVAVVVASDVVAAAAGQEIAVADVVAVAGIGMVDL